MLSSMEARNDKPATQNEPRRKRRSPSKRHKPSSRSFLMTLQQASEESGLPPSTIRDQVYKGNLERVELPGTDRTYIKREQFERLIGAAAQ